MQPLGMRKAGRPACERTPVFITVILGLVVAYSVIGVLAFRLYSASDSPAAGSSEAIKPLHPASHTPIPSTPAAPSPAVVHQSAPLARIDSVEEITNPELKKMFKEISGLRFHNSVKKNNYSAIYSTVTDHGDYLEHYFHLPPFHWEVPRGLSEEDLVLFFKQPEHHHHCADSDLPGGFVTYEIPNGEVTYPISKNENSSHYFNIYPPFQHCANPTEEIAVVVGGRGINMFQHAMDNGVPPVAVGAMAVGDNITKATLVIDRWDSETIPTVFRKMGFKDVVKQHRTCAKRLFVPGIIPRVNAATYYGFKYFAKFNHSIMDKVILVSRQSDGNSHQRIISNQHVLEEALRAKYGDDFVVFHPSRTPIEEAFELFQRARMILGMHGGGMYHHYWASTETKVVEIMPIQPNGLYHGQHSFSQLAAIAPMAMFTNTLLFEQPFYRYYHRGPSTIIDLDVPRFMKWLATFD